MCINNKFSTVCDDLTWGAPEAQVVCSQLNLTTNGGGKCIVRYGNSCVCVRVAATCIFDCNFTCLNLSFID